MLGAVLALPAPALAVSPAMSPAEAAGDVATAGAGQRDAAQRYWTVDRMADALPVTPAGAPIPDHPNGTGRAATGLLSTSAGDEARLVGATRWTAASPVTDVVGKVFFTRAGRPYVCSAASVGAGAVGVVVTAGHCTFQAGRPVENFVFVPGYAAGVRPHGTWPAQTLLTTEAWRTAAPGTPAALAGDVGFAVLAPQDGRSLGEVVGALDIAFAPVEDPAGSGDPVRPGAAEVTVLGYPAGGGEQDGEHLTWCAGPTDRDTTTTRDRSIGCAMSGGSSGGPWITDLDPRTGSGTVTSVVSFAYEGDTSTLFGPVLGPGARAAYDAARTTPPR